MSYWKSGNIFRLAFFKCDVLFMFKYLYKIKMEFERSVKILFFYML